MVNMLYMQFVYLALCLSIATVEIYLIVCYKTSKPAVFITLSDMVSCDLCLLFLASLYLVSTAFLLASAKLEIRPVLAYIIAPTGTFVTLIIVFYLLCKILVEYFQLRLRVVDLADEYQQEDLLLFIRLTIVFVAISFTVLIHVISGVSPVYYFITETDLTPEALLNFVLVIALSLTVSGVCLILKFVTRNEKRMLLAELGKVEYAKLPFWTYFIGILIIIFVMFSVVVSFIVNTVMVHFVFKNIIFGVCATKLPGIIICKDKKLQVFAIKHIKKKLVFKW